jgi:hypothetical protein
MQDGGTNWSDIKIAQEDFGQPALLEEQKA